MIYIYICNIDLFSVFFFQINVCFRHDSIHTFLPPGDVIFSTFRFDTFQQRMGWSRVLASKPTTSFLRLESPSKRWKSKKDLWRIGYKRWIYMNLLIILHECKYQFLNTTPFSGISFFNLLCWLRIKSGVSQYKINDSESSWGVHYLSWKTDPMHGESRSDGVSMELPYTKKQKIPATTTKVCQVNH